LILNLPQLGCLKAQNMTPHKGVPSMNRL